MGVIAAILRLLLAALLARAAWHKWRERPVFVRELDAYRLLPAPLAAPAAVALAVAETSAVLLLLWPSTGAAGLALAGALLLLYGSAMAINLGRGRSDIDCGCSAASGAKKTLAWPLVIRNVALALPALYLAMRSDAALPAQDLWLVAAGTACCALLYEAVEQALANAEHRRRWQARQPLRS